MLTAMATVRREIRLDRRPDEVWAAVRDFGAVHLRLAVGFVVDTTVEDDCRTVTFADGGVVRERLISLDDVSQRLAYTVVSGGLGSTHHSASMQVVADGPGCRLIWITDVLPDALARPIAARVEAGLDAVAKTLAG
jgi:carbon monoxide dehydrogenase subunit G